jgi:hypothetical protein
MDRPNLPAEMFHFADAANWASIQREGLLSTDMILRRGGFPAPVDAAVRAYRPKGIVLPNGGFVRDQSPMPPASLAACLDEGLAAQDWYDLVNQCVFFWLDARRVARHRHALRHRPQVLLTIDVAELVARYSKITYVTPFNIGNARRRPARRSERSLVPLAEWEIHGWKSESGSRGQVRSRRHKPAELVVRGPIPDILSLVTSTRRLPALT